MKEHPTDVHVGSRVRMRRMMLGLSQEHLGDALGLTFQQIKYEKGSNRISANELQQIAGVLQVSESFFFTTDCRLNRGSRLQTGRYHRRRTWRRSSRHPTDLHWRESFHGAEGLEAQTFRRGSRQAIVGDEENER